MSKALGILVAAALVGVFWTGPAGQAVAKTPVILDTDIGDDIDDTWALAMLLNSPDLDLKLVTTTFGKAEYRGKILAKLLTVAGRTDVAVGLGEGGRGGDGGQAEWVKDFKLSDYKGKVHEDGVGAIIDLIEKSAEPVTVIAIGPTPTLKAVLERKPEVAAKANFVGMQGSVRKGYGGSATPAAEWNIVCDVAASKKVLLAPWKSTTITPLDTCGLVQLSGERFEKLKKSDKPLVKALLENYRMWAKKAQVSELTASSTLFDTVAVYLTYSGAKPLLEFEQLNIGVTDKGFTPIDPNGAKMNVAVNWKNLDGYYDLLVSTLTGEPADDPWAVYEGKEGVGKGKHIVFVTGDEEYRSEESMPQLAKILAAHFGFKCTVLFAISKADGTIDTTEVTNIPGLEALDTADLMVLFTRFRELPDEQMKHIIDYTNSGRPIVALRTATHPFNYTKNMNSPYAKYSFNNGAYQGGYGRQILGETWVNHHGDHQKESTRGVIAEGMKDSPIVRGVTDVWGPSDVYTINGLTGDSKPVIMGQVLVGMSSTDAVNTKKAEMPVAWIKTFTGDKGKAARIFTTTMGHNGDFLNEGFRRLMVNAVFWALGMEDKIPMKANVDIVGEYKPNPIGFGKHVKGVKPSDLK